MGDGISLVHAVSGGFCVKREGPEPYVRIAGLLPAPEQEKTGRRAKPRWFQDHPGPGVSLKRPFSLQIPRLPGILPTAE